MNRYISILLLLLAASAFGPAYALNSDEEKTWLGFRWLEERSMDPPISDAQFIELSRDGSKAILGLAQDSSAFDCRVSLPGGGYGSPIISPTEAAHNLVYFEDINNDGNVDTVATATNANTIHAYLGDGAGSFTPVESITLQYALRSINLEDIDNDGNTDILYKYKDPENIYYTEFHLGDGTGAFGDGNILLSSTVNHLLDFDDFNGDQILDICALYSYREVVIMPGIGNASFGDPIKTNLPSEIDSRILSADTNLDGISDIISYNPSLKAILVTFGDRLNDFTTTVASSLKQSNYLGDSFSSQSNSEKILDVNQDEIPDLYFARLENTKKTYWYSLGLGDGTFAPPVGLVYPINDIFDIDQNGTLDAISKGLSGPSALGNIQYMPGVGNGAIGGPYAYPTIESPDLVDQGDFNNDGYIDFATISGLGLTSFDCVLAVHLSNANGAPSETITYYLGNELPRGLAVTDLNSDQHDDIVISFRYGEILTAEADSKGRFSLPIYNDWGNNPNQLRVVDLDSDGLSDVVASNDLISVLWGDDINPVPSILPPIEGLRASLDLLIQDFNSDGLLDVGIQSNLTSPTVFSVTLNEGNRQFSRNILSSTPTDIKTVKHGYFNLDSYPDLLMTPEEGNHVYMMIGNGDGTFASPMQISIGGVTLIYSTSAGDVDRDGKDDLVLAGELGGTSKLIILARGNGDGTFLSPEIIADVSSLSLDRIDTADLNADGRLDILVRGNRSLATYLGNGDGTFRQLEGVSGPNISIDYPDSSLNNLRDINGDSILDITAVSNHILLFRLGTGDGNFQEAYFIDTLDHLLRGVTISGWGFGDFDGDDNFDLAIQSYSFQNEVAMMIFGNEQGTFSKPRLIDTDIDILKTYVHDFNNDGFPDILIAEGLVLKSIYWGDPDGNFSQSTSVNLEIDFAGISFGDINGDTFIDIYPGFRSSELGMPVYFNDGAGNFVTAYLNSVTAPHENSIILDFNDDGYQDFASFFYDNIYILYGDEDLEFNQLELFEAADWVVRIVAEDFNGDGWLDIAATSDQHNYPVLQVFAGIDGHNFELQQQIAIGSYNALLHTGDVNNDGFPDLILQHLNANSLSVYPNRGTIGAPLPPTAGWYFY